MNNNIPEGYHMTELGLIPEDWEVVKLGDIFEIKQGKALSPKHRKGISPKPFIRTSNVLWGKVDLSHIDYMDFNEEEVEKYMLKPNDLLVCEGGDIGRTAIWSLDEGVFCYQNHIHRLRPKNSGAYPLFYMYWMQAALLLLRIYKGVGNVTTIPNLSRSRLSNFLLPLPPLPEQQKIAHVLSTIQEAKEKTEAVINASKELKKSLMKYLFTYGPVPLNEAENVKLKETEIGKMPKNWDIKPLEALILNKNQGINTTTEHIKYSTRGGIPVVRAKNIMTPVIDFSDTVFIDEETNNKISDKFKPKLNDVLYCNIGSQLGSVAIVKKSKNFIIAWNVLRLQIKKDIVLPNYVCFSMEKEKTRIRSHSKKSTMPFVSGSVLLKINFRIPPQVDQERIVNILVQIENKIRREKNKLSCLENLFKSMLHNLMTGKVRVKDLDIGIEEENKEVETVEKYVGK